MPEEVIIYKAEDRNFYEDNYKKYSTLKYNASRNESDSFLDLCFIDDFFLQANSQIELNEFYGFQILIFPIIGGVEIKNLQLAHNFIGAEQYFWKPKNEALEITNPYQHNEVNFLCIGFDNLKLKNDSKQFGSIDFSQKNILIKIIDFLFLKIFVGIYEGRKEGVLLKSKNYRGIFCFIIGGVFEVNGRLLHPRDSLSFISKTKIEFEALAENSIILIIETT